MLSSASFNYLALHCHRLLNHDKWREKKEYNKYKSEEQMYDSNIEVFPNLLHFYIPQAFIRTVMPVNQKTD